MESKIKTELELVTERAARVSPAWPASSRARRTTA